MLRDTRLLERTEVKRSIALPGVLLLALTACGGGGDDSEASENIAASIQQDSSISEEDADCFAENVVDSVGVDQLKEIGILNDDLEVEGNLDEADLSPQDAEKAAEAFTGCIDIDIVLEEAFAGAGDEAIACVKEKIDEDAYQDLMTATFAGDETAAQDAMLSAAECLTP